MSRKSPPVEHPALVPDLDWVLRALHHPQRLMRRLVELAVKRSGASSGSLMLLNPNTGALDIEISIGLNKDASRVKLALGQGITGWVASSARPLRVGDVLRERRYVALNRRVRSELAVPILLRDQVIGILNVDSLRKDAFTAEHESDLMDLATEAAEWLSHAWEMGKLRTRSQQLETLVEMGQNIVSEVDLSRTLNGITRQVCRLMKAKLCSLMLVNDAVGQLELRAWYGAPRAYIRKPSLPIEESLVGVVLRRQKPLAVMNVQENDRFQHTELAKREGLVSLLSVPLVFESRAIGVVSIYTGKLHRFSNEEIRLLEAMAGLSAVAITKARILERVVQTEESLKAAERLSALGWLAAEVAHEIRNPLTVMQMLFHALIENIELEGASAKDAELIEGKMKQMNRIVDQVLTFAQSAQPQLEPTVANDVLQDVLLLMRHKLARQQITVRRRISREKLMCRADRPQLEQAILNLALNACQAMPDGGTLTLGVRRHKSASGDYVELGVRDTGQGMSQQVQDTMFEPFLTHRQGGTGLGLALVRKTVDAHGGRIRISSKIGKGTHVRIQIPIDPGT